MGYEWTELTYQQILASKDILTKLAFPLGVVFVFLVLAAQYESWSLPLAIILIVPMCLLAALTGHMAGEAGRQHLRPDRLGRADRAGRQERDPDRRVRQAAGRHGPAAFRGHGRCLPAAAAADSDDLVRVHPGRGSAGAGQGRGAEMRFTLGLAVFSGMLGVTVFGIFFTPIFYYVIRWFSGRRQSEVS